MNEKRFSIFNIFLFCIVFGLFFFVKIDSYADTGYNTSGTINNVWLTTCNWSTAGDNIRFCFYQNNNNYPVLYCNQNINISVRQVLHPINGNTSPESTNYFTLRCFLNDDNIYQYTNPGSSLWGYQNFMASVPVFSSGSDCVEYILNGTVPDSVIFDDTLKLDDFKITSWQLGYAALVNFDSRFTVTWSDSRISTVKVDIKGNRSANSYLGSSSPYKGSFDATDFANVNGDVITLIATPYKSDGSYGVSLMYSFKYNQNNPITNVWRKIVNSPYSDHTIEIPYNGPSGNTSETLPVDGVTENICYELNYNPITYEYGDMNVYEIYYSPVLVYQVDTPEETVDSTQDVVNNSYVTNNYYETTKNVNLNFDFNFDDISNNDIQDTYTGVGTFFDGFGGLIGKIVDLLTAVFPFLSPGVAVSIVFAFGLMVTLAIIALILKIVGVIADIIPF